MLVAELGFEVEVVRYPVVELGSKVTELVKEEVIGLTVIELVGEEVSGFTVMELVGEEVSGFTVMELVKEELPGSTVKVLSGLVNTLELPVAEVIVLVTSVDGLTELV